MRSGAKRQVKKPERRPYELKIQVGALVHDVSRLRKNVFDKAWKPLGITRSQWWLLVNLSQQDGASQRQLASVMNMSQVAVGEALPLLEAAGFITRHADTVDRRQKLISLTDKGYELLGQSREISSHLNNVILRDVPPEDLAATERTLRTMRNNLSELDP